METLVHGLDWAVDGQFDMEPILTVVEDIIFTILKLDSNVMESGWYSGSEDGTVKIWDLRSHGCQRESESPAAVNTVVLHLNQTELISGDQNGNIRVWDLTANSCSLEWVPEHDTAMRSLTMIWDRSLVVAANNCGTCYSRRVWKGNQALTRFEPLHKLQAHDGYILKCLPSPELCDLQRYLVTASSDHTIKVWNVDGFTLEKTLTVSSDATAKCWSMATGECERVYKQYKAIICCALGNKAKPPCGMPLCKTMYMLELIVKAVRVQHRTSFYPRYAMIFFSQQRFIK
ncbi:hypothetical protein QJS10_CPB14g01542 [Acorus calamus]|uniref:Target of rapamycin complex subunit LST8 n=1 Tax=Acorus calamus TaxID=4465 RepID=A0AAV9DAR2_ACOCL|nr:hypothetical protein QJS10_CPB14g01542 [Acorus calamus]